MGFNSAFKGLKLSCTGVHNLSKNAKLSKRLKTRLGIDSKRVKIIEEAALKTDEVWKL